MIIKKISNLFLLFLLIHSSNLFGQKTGDFTGHQMKTDSTYYLFLNSHLEYPKEAIENEIEGNVLITITIDSNCSTNYVINQSLGYGCDEACIKVISGIEDYLKIENKNHCIPMQLDSIPFSFRIE